MSEIIQDITPEQPDGEVELVGKKVNRYDVLELVGRGSMGVLFKAKDVENSRDVALKVLSRKLIYSSRPWYERLVREVEAIARLNHPNIVKGLGCGRQGNLYYLAMEFVEGCSLEDLLRRRGRLPEHASLSITLQVAKALDHANQMGMVHRDIKPKNILVTNTGHVKVTDFGLVKFVGDAYAAEREALIQPDKKFRTPPVLVVGTPRFLSPEQARRAPEIDIRADIYSLGLVLFTMLTGRFPFTGTPVEIVLKQMNEPVPDIREMCPEISEKTAAVVRKMTAKLPEDRYATPADLIVDVTACLIGSLMHNKATRGAADGTEETTVRENDAPPAQNSDAAQNMEAELREASRKKLFCARLATGQRFFFSVREGQESYLGRDIASSEVVIPDPLASKAHCIITCANGEFSITDCGSANGTHVNGKRILNAKLHSGDIIRIGRTEIIVP
ncbi:MAG TPA: FHA domain-containing serine/threonine-protein kinase [Candidatus Brocadiia bacterium]|nr:FHA domain-containing serine/threonine-protein kinase [Candidatus Brocadiia bacterium]